MFCLKTCLTKYVGKNFIASASLLATVRWTW